MQKILWFQDGAKLGVNPNRWSELDKESQKLISLVGHPNFQHELIDPTSLLQVFADQLPRDASCVIDLSGNMRMILTDVFPAEKIVSDFHLSRLRVVSSAKMDGFGFLLNRPKNEFQQLGDGFDLSQPLIIDDVGWSGRSALELANLIGFEPSCASFGFIVCNDGAFGEKPGAKGLIEKKGGAVLSGGFVQTPNDDGFHLADFFDHPNIGERKLFDLLIIIQGIREEIALDPGRREEGEKAIKQIINNSRNLLFPNALDSEQVRQLHNKGRIVGINSVCPDSLFQTNPLNWFLPSFAKRVKMEDMIANREPIQATLCELKRICTEGRVARIEGGSTNRKEVER